MSKYQHRFSVFTQKQAIKAAEKLRKKLYSSADHRHKFLSYALDDCIEGAPCKQVFCPICTRNWQLHWRPVWAPQFLLLDRVASPKFITVVLETFPVADRDALMAVDLNRLKQRLRWAFQKVAHPGQYIFGGIEIGLRRSKDRWEWSVHAHCVWTNFQKTQADQLRRIFGFGRQVQVDGTDFSYGVANYATKLLLAYKVKGKNKRQYLRMLPNPCLYDYIDWLLLQKRHWRNFKLEFNMGQIKNYEANFPNDVDRASNKYEWLMKRYAYG